MQYSNAVLLSIPMRVEQVPLQSTQYYRDLHLSGLAGSIRHLSNETQPLVLVILAYGFEQLPSGELDELQQEETYGCALPFFHCEWL